MIINKKIEQINVSLKKIKNTIQVYEDTRQNYPMLFSHDKYMELVKIKRKEWASIINEKRKLLQYRIQTNSKTLFEDVKIFDNFTKINFSTAEIEYIKINSICRFNDEGVGRFYDKAVTFTLKDQTKISVDGMAEIFRDKLSDGECDIVYYVEDTGW